MTTKEKLMSMLPAKGVETYTISEIIESCDLDIEELNKVYCAACFAQEYNFAFMLSFAVGRIYESKFPHDPD
jgi:hypothetical protein